MAEMQAQQAWAVAYSPTMQIEMSQEYGADALKQLNECLARGDFQVLSRDTQGYIGDLVIDFAVSGGESYRALVLLKK